MSYDLLLGHLGVWDLDHFESDRHMRPFGYETDRITIRDHEAEILRDVADRLLAGESLRSVTASINDGGARTPGGNLWQANVLRRVVMSPRIAGKVQGRDGRLKKAEWPPILDAATYKKLVKLLGDASRNSGTTQTARVYLLTGGIAHCGLCGKPLIARPNNDGKRGYVCSSGSPYEGCGKIRINAEPFEQDVTERVLARLLRPDAREKLGAALKAAGREAAEAHEVIAKTEKRLGQIGVDYADGKIGGIEFRTARDELTKRIRDARNAQKLGVTLGDVAALESEDLVAWWEGASLEQQRTLLDVLISKIEVYPVRVRGSKIFDPSRIKVTWRRS